MEAPLRLLLIEDSIGDEKLLTRELRRGGFTLDYQRVETAEAMSAALAGGSWDLIISDYRLPAFSGPEALALLKQTGLDLPFVIVSGTIGEVNAVDVMIAGANDYVMKDNLARLVPAIRRELADARVRGDHQIAVAALHESEARFRNMADSAPVLLWISDPEGSTTYVNRQWLNFTGQSSETATSSARTDTVHPADVERLWEARMAATAGNEGFRIEFRMLRGDGEWRWMLETGSPRYQHNGEFAGFIGTCVDLTERKEAEEENYRLLQEKELLALQQKRLVRDILYSVSDGKLRVCDSRDELPEKMEAACEIIPLSLTGGIRDLRYSALETMGALGYPDERCHDLVSAIGEAGMNAVIHAGGGSGQIRSNGRDIMQAWIIDEGLGIDIEYLPRATLEKGYTTVGSFGHGMKMMLGFVDRLWLHTRPTGTIVVLEQDMVRPLPSWA